MIVELSNLFVQVEPVEPVEPVDLGVPLVLALLTNRHHTSVPCVSWCCTLSRKLRILAFRLSLYIPLLNVFMFSNLYK